MERDYSENLKNFLQEKYRDSKPFRCQKKDLIYTVYIQNQQFEIKESLVKEAFEENLSQAKEAIIKIAKNYIKAQDPPGVK